MRTLPILKMKIIIVTSWQKLIVMSIEIANLLSLRISETTMKRIKS